MVQRHGATDEDSHPSGELWLLWNEHLRYLSSIGIVFTGGILTLIQTTALEVGPDSLIPMGLFLGGTLASLFAQSSIVDAATNRKNKVPKAAKILRVASFSLLGGGVGYFLKSVFDHFT